MKTLLGESVPLEVRGSDLVYRLKELMQDKKGYPPQKQRLAHRFKGVLDDAKTLNEYGLTEGDTVHQILALRQD
jgi:ubiquitin-like protein Nedd8